MNPQDAALVSQITNNVMGQPPGTPPAPAPQAATPTPQAAAPQQTPQEQATQAVQPTDEAAKAAEAPMSFIKLKMNGQERALTEQQIASTFERYSDLNYRHAQVAPVVAFAEKLMQATAQSGQQVQPAQLAQFLEAATRAYVSNPQLGQQSRPTPTNANAAAPGIPVGPNNSDMDAEIARWEEENGVKMPPRYKQGLAQLNTMGQRQQQLEQAMMQILQQAGGLNQQANTMAQKATQDRTQALRQMAANNLNQAQQRFQLPDDAEQDFYTFAFERGYTSEDFVDPNLTMKVVSDFSAARNTPEMERLRAIAQRRQAYTGVTSSGPGAPASGTPQANPDMQFIGQVADAHFKKKNMA